MPIKAKSMTKAELIRAITQKTKKIPTRFQPAVKRSFLAGLKYKTNPQLKRILSKMHIAVDKTGYDIYLTR